MTARPALARLGSRRRITPAWRRFLNIIKRAGPHFLESETCMVLVGTRLESQPAQFPPTEYLLDDQQATDVVLGPTGRLYSCTIVHPGKDKAPYGLAMVDFGEVRAFGRLLFDGKPPALDSLVRVVSFTLPGGTPDYAFQE
jgi:uncharacterized OB-fold protein